MNGMRSALPGRLASVFEEHKYLAWLAVAAVITGILLRFVGLDRWALAQDEYYMARSVELILSQGGLPAYLCGGYYTRGLPVQYLMASLSLLGMELEFVARYISAALSLAALPAIYIIGRRVAGTKAALCALILCSLSLWQIEFARFGRMYAPFQTVFLWYLVFFLLDLDSARVKHYAARIALSVVGALLWEGGIFLMVLNLVPPFVRPRRRPVLETAFALALLVANYAFLEYPFRYINQPPTRPPDAPAVPGVPGWSPGELTILLTGTSIGWLLAFLVIAGVAAWRTIGHARREQWPGRVQLLAAASLGLAALNQLAILIPIALAGLLFLRQELSWKRFVAALAAPVALLAGFWLVYLLWSRGVPLIGQGDVTGAVRAILRPIAAYPSYLHYLARPWWESVPHLMISIGLLTGVAFFLRAPAITDSARDLQGLLVLLLVLVAMAMSGFQMITRYSYFLVPILYILSSASLVDLLSFRRHRRRMATAFGILLLLGLTSSEDFRPGHMATIASYETNFRMGFDSALEMHYYPRFDYRSPAVYVNEHARDGDLIVATDQVFGFYLDRLDYVYHDAEANNFGSLVCDLGRRDRWTDAALLYRPDMVRDAIGQHAGTVWLLIRSAAYPYVKPWEAPLRERYASDLVFTSPDERLSVYRITPSGASPP